MTFNGFYIIILYGLKYYNGLIKNKEDMFKLNLTTKMTNNTS